MLLPAKRWCRSGSLRETGSRRPHQPASRRALPNNLEALLYPLAPAHGPLYDFYVFYVALLEKGMRPAMARLTLARKIATITLTIWKKGVDFDAKQLHRQAA